MGFFNNSITPSVAPSTNPLLLPGETAISTFKLVFDQLILTDRRIIFTDGKALSGKKRTISVAYSKISAIEIERGGALNFGQEITIISGSKEWEIKCYNAADSSQIFKMLSEKIY